MADPNLYFKVTKGDMLILILYVDDFLITGEEHLINQCKKDLASELEMKALGILHYFLGLEVREKSRNIFLHQKKYIVDILNGFGMWDYQSMSTPMETSLHKLKEARAESKLVNPTLYRQITRSLMYLVNTRLDICYVVNTLS